MVVSDRTKGCCSSDLNEPPRPTMTNLLNLTHTTQKYSVLQLDYNYSVVQYVLDHLSEPFHQWTGE